MRRTENPENVVRLHEVPLNDTIPYGTNKMEFVAQLVEHQVVALVVMGSMPIKLPNASIA